MKDYKLKLRNLRASHTLGFELLFIIRVKRELKRVYRHGCRYNERLNTETGGSKTSRIHWVTLSCSVRPDVSLTSADVRPQVT